MGSVLDAVLRAAKDRYFAARLAEIGEVKLSLAAPSREVWSSRRGRYRVTFAAGRELEVWRNGRVVSTRSVEPDELVELSGMT